MIWRPRSQAREDDALDEATGSFAFLGRIYPMNRYDCLEFLVTSITDQLVLGSLSGQRVEWGHMSRHPGNLLIAPMGAALGMGVGLALVLPHRKVIVLESDGSPLLSLYNLPTLGNLNVPNLAVFVFDNEVYSGTRVSEPSATAGKTDLAGSRGAGYGTGDDRQRPRILQA